MTEGWDDRDNRPDDFVFESKREFYRWVIGVVLPIVISVTVGLGIIVLVGSVAVSCMS